MESIYRVEGAIADTSAFAGGPWSPKLQHGAAPSSLICWAVERLPSPVPMRIARLTVDLMRPVPVAPLAIETEIVREGRKIQLVSVRLLADGEEVVRASALRIRIDPKEMPAIAGGRPWNCRCRSIAARPISSRPRRPSERHRDAHGQGGFRIPGPAAVWYRATRPIVEGAAISPLMRAVIAADFCNGTSSVFDMKDWTFINADLSVSLGASRSVSGSSRRRDLGGTRLGGHRRRATGRRHGYFGRAVQSVIFEKR